MTEPTAPARKLRSEELRARLAGKDLDKEQLLAYRYAWAVAEEAASRALSAFAARSGERVVEVLADLFAKEVAGEEAAPAAYEEAGKLVLEAGGAGDPGLDEDHKMIADTFRGFAEDKVAPIAEKVHREDLLIPEDIISGLKELGCFGLSIPQKYGGFQDDQKPDNLGMIVVTEELSRGSLGIAGSLITRPEILAKALLKGGTDAQRDRLLPVIASGEKMVSVCATEPDFGSDVAGMKVTATKVEDGYLLNGVKTWATFAGRAEILMVLARTDPDLSKKHKGLSVLIAEKPPFEGHSFEYQQPAREGKISGRAIGTIGYRGMHSYEVSFENYYVPIENVVGGDAGLGKGFYLQMEGFSGGRLQTAARAVGVMQAAFEAAIRYSQERKVFGQPIGDYQLTRWKLARMGMLVQGARQLSYEAAAALDSGRPEGQFQASLVKLFASKVAEWVTREAQQIHGGMGYAEEYAVSRYFVDARVFSIFEGAEEILALKVIARALLEEKK
jgi:(2S)-methylsuccinyl-CoA dehydrogenase